MGKIKKWTFFWGHSVVCLTVH